MNCWLEAKAILKELGHPQADELTVGSADRSI